MNLLKLVIVDDEPILLRGMLETYHWEEMGFTIAGTAQSGEQAIDLIQKKRPHVVLTDIRMKQITGLMMMEEIQHQDIDCLFVILSAYRDFEYAQQACDLGAFAYLLKPLDEQKLYETMGAAYRNCMEQIRSEEKYESWERLLKNDATSFVQVVVQKYLQNRISYQKMEEVFAAVSDVIEPEDRFITLQVDVDIAYKITHSLEYEAARFSLFQYLDEMLTGQYFNWRFEDEEGRRVFIIKTGDRGAVKNLKEMMETLKQSRSYPVIAAISKPYKKLPGIKRSFTEASRLFELASAAGAGAFTITRDVEESGGDGYSRDAELLIVNAVRKNSLPQLKDSFVNFIYCLPDDEEMQRQYLHKVMLRVEFLLRDSYGLTKSLQENFQNYYSNLQSMDMAKSLDVCYRLLCSVIEERLVGQSGSEAKYFSDYMEAATAYIEEHLDDEELSIVSVAAHIYLNPVYFGRVFKNTYKMTFKKYLMQQRMERAKELILEGNENIASVCVQVGIASASYFSHLFKQYTGILPSEYKKVRES